MFEDLNLPKMPESSIRLDRLHYALSFVAGYRDGQSHDAFMEPAWRQDTYINVLKCVMSLSPDVRQEVPLTGREETTRLAAGHLAVLSAFDTLAIPGSRLLQKMFDHAGLDEGAVAEPIIQEYWYDKFGNRQETPQNLKGCIYLADLGASEIQIGAAIRATGQVIDRLHTELLQEGYDATDPQTLRRIGGED